MSAELESSEVYCRDCGAVISERAEICPECEIRQQEQPVNQETKDRVEDLEEWEMSGVREKSIWLVSIVVTAFCPVLLLAYYDWAMGMGALVIMLLFGIMTAFIASRRWSKVPYWGPGSFDKNV